MKYVYIALAVLLVLLIVLIIVCICRRRRARKLVMLRTDKQKCTDLNAALEPFGFAYDICSDSFYSLMYPWQRKMGYCRFYDESAPMLNIVVDSEPVYFSCMGRSYLLQIWKGQYGMSTGGEIGFYVSREKGRPEELFYDSVSDEECINMSFVLRKNGRVLLERRCRHWWLTGFALGEFSHREQLSMEVRLEFSGGQMAAAFYEGLLRAGYTKESIRMERNCIAFYFTSPKTSQSRHCRLRIWCVQWRNKRNCRCYLHVTRFFERTLDRVDYLGMCFPRLYRKIIRMGRSVSMRICRRRMERQIRRGCRRYGDCRR